ncbi:MAG: tetratricopeptide repeat protein [Proteobacteria bacterium]|nr:tetratricopeptide repeat protein [Pseudomonadota bacterium]
MTVLECRECQAENREGRRFCGECGTPLAMCCPECDFANEPGEKFCGGCGRPTTDKPATPSRAPSGERRPVTVLFADIVGFTEMSSNMDAEEIHRILGRFFEITDGLVARYGGSIDKHIGDNVMAVFGAPVAHGDDPARAVRTAIDIHKAMPGLAEELGVDLQVHIGIASGQVVASDTGSSHHKEYTVTGDTVNLASRLDGMAGSGETLISDTVYRAVAALVEAEDAGDTTVKGLDKPVRIWRLRGLAESATDKTRLPFVGRQALLAQVDGILSGCRQSSAGQTILLRGEAGIGKTRLMDEITITASGQGYRCYRGLILDFGIGKGQDAIAMLVRGLLETSADTGANLVARSAEGGLIEQDDSIFLYDLLGMQQPNELRATYDAMDGEAREAGKRELVSRIIRAASARGPVLLEIEDIHWGGHGTLGFIASIASAIQDCPSVLIMTSRIEGDPIDQSWRANARTPLITIDLEPLRADEALSLAGTLFDSSDRFALNCVERANGNPLFLEQLLRNAEESEDENIPDSIQSLVMARLDRLEPEDKSALQAASILGQRFGLEVLRSLLDSPSYDCASLLKHALLRPAGEDFLFAHALIREGVNASLLKTTRRELHQRAANWYADRDAVLFAEHLDRARDARAPRAYLEAARAEAAEYRFDRVLEIADRGLELATENTDRFALVCQRGDFLRELGSVEGSIAAFRQAAELAEDDTGKSKALIGLASGMRLTDQYDEALAALEDAEPAATAQKLDLRLAQIHHLRGNLYFPLGRIDDCRAQHELALEFARRANSAELEAAALGGLGDAAYGSGKMRSATDHFARCLKICREHRLGRVEVANHHMLGWSRVYLNELEPALENSLETVDAAVRLGQLRAEIMGRGCAASVLLDLGRQDEAIQQLDRSLDIIRRLGARRFEAQNMCFRSRALMTNGQHAQALPLLRQALSIAKETGTGFVAPFALGCLARASDNVDERKAAIEGAESMLAAGAVGHNYFWFYREAMQGALERGEWKDARRFADALEDYASAEPLPWSDFFIARVRALAAAGEGRRDEALTAELARLRDIAVTVGFKVALEGIDNALEMQQAAE